ncbi:MAG: ATP-binding protein [candidate division Zixibacteria bacterium]
MDKPLKYDQPFVLDKNPWFLIIRLFLAILLAGSALSFLKPTVFNHTLIAVYSALCVIYFAYNISAKDFSREFFGGIVIAQLALELLVEGLLVNHVGGSFSPFILFFIISIVISALYFHLLGSIIVATLAGLLYSLPVFFDISFVYDRLIESPRLAGTGITSDESFYTVFLHLCLFYFFGFISGFLAQKLFVTSLELKRLRLETGEILEQMRSGFLTVDKTGQIVYFNRASGSILGFDPKMVRGRSIDDIFGDNQKEFRDRINAALISMKSEDRSEIKIVSAEGRQIPIGLSLSVIKDDLKKQGGVIAVFQDLTEAKKLEERMRTTDRLAAVGQLAASIAHEIRNPLASISGSVEVLKDDLKPDGENLRLMELILKETSRLNTILYDFLNFARIDKGGSGRCDLGVIISEVIDLAKGNEACESVEFSCKLHRPVIMVAGGEDQIRQVLWNLILNSSQAMNQDAGRIRIYTEDYTDDKSGDMIRLIVADNGPGIPDNVREKIFDPFYSTKQGGTGLGLSIVVRIIDHLGGRTEVDSSEGSGTEFVIYFPREVAKSKSVELQEVM